MVSDTLNPTWDSTSKSLPTLMLIYSDKMLDLVEQDYLSDVYNLSNANTLSVLNSILSQVQEEGNARVPTNAKKIKSLYE